MATAAEEKVGTDAPVKIGGRYKESDEHVPNPTDMYDTYNTSGTGSHHELTTISPVFEIARKTSAVRAARALNPKDHEVPSSEVILPDTEKPAHEDLKKEIARRGDEAKKHPAVVGGPTPAQKEAAEGGKAGQERAASETRDQGAGGEGTAAAGAKTGSASDPQPSAAAAHRAAAGDTSQKKADSK